MASKPWQNDMPFLCFLLILMEFNFLFFFVSNIIRRKKKKMVKILLSFLIVRFSLKINLKTFEFMTKQKLF